MDENVCVQALRKLCEKNSDAENIEFEERPQQIALLKKICGMFNSGGVGIYEAGTGVGQTFAYLLPAILWASERDERVVVSTGTINLQQQLIEKDIPSAEKILGRQIKAVLVKGRANYLCLRRLHDALRESENQLFQDDVQEIQDLERWSKTSPTGSRSDQSFSFSDKVWNQVCSENDACLFGKCKYFDKCFVQKMRKEAAEAQILVANHHILFADLAARSESASYDDAVVLPPYRHIVFDEAHKMEDAATSFFSQGLTRFALARQLGLLYRAKRGLAAGRLFEISSLSESDVKIDDVIKKIEEVKDFYDKIDEIACGLLGDKKWAKTWRVCAETADASRELCKKMRELRVIVAELTNLAREMISSIDEKKRDEDAVWETQKILARIDAIGVFCENFSNAEGDSENVYWFEKFRLRDGNGNYAHFAITPLDISERMRESLFEPFDTVICTSATIQIENSFKFWMRRVGLCDESGELIDLRKPLDFAEFDSPFPYEENVVLGVPRDLPQPNEKEFQAAFEYALEKLIKAAKGRTLVLFTSYEAMRETASAMRQKLGGLTILSQSDGDDRHALLDAFKNDKTSVLLGTDSFWEGVDVRGDALVQVVIAKLPFKVPDDPVFAARCDKIKNRGGMPFFELSVPDAAIKFRQGFGRLMRSCSDYGVVVVCDRRIYEKSYGASFISCLPKIRKVTRDIDDLAENIGDFLTRKSAEAASKN